jgi:glutamate dehydrogenase (NAD(P)+)
VYVTLEALRHLRIDIGQTTVAIQGFGNVGAHTARIMHEAGVKIIAVSDVSGGIYNSCGLDIPKLLSTYKSTVHILADTKLGDAVTNSELLELKCTVLIPAALSEQITEHNAARLNCRVLAEGANGPTTLEADRIVQDKGIFVIPDILANSGGVIVSYFEWVQDAQRFFWKATDIQDRLRDLMTSAFQRTLQFATDKRTSMRMAALMTGIDKVAQAHLNRGLYP